jgi:hypothetical protein
MSDRKPPPVVFWMTVIAVTLLVAYPLSFGPAVWGDARGYVSHSFVAYAWWPLLWTVVHGPKPAAAPLKWWVLLGIPRGSWADFHVDDSGDGFICFFRR